MVEKNTGIQVVEDRKVCFVIMPFSDPEGYEKGHFKKIYEQIFKPAIEDAGYTAFRMDENSESTLIQAKIYNHLINEPMVLCDLSSKNPNVLYELGIRHAYDKPVVLVQEEGQSHIFDIAGLTTVSYRKNRLYDEVVQDQKNIAEAIKQTANAQNNYSVMSLVNLNPATLDSKNGITKEDKLEILISDLNRKMNRFEEHISREQLSSKAMIIDKEREIFRFEIERRLRVNIDRARMILNQSKEPGEMPSAKIIRIRIRALQDVIIDCQSANIADSLIDEAKEYLVKLQELEESLVTTL